MGCHPTSPRYGVYGVLPSRGCLCSARRQIFSLSHVRVGYDRPECLASAHRRSHLPNARSRPTPVGESIVWGSLAQGELGQRPFFVRPAAVRLARTYLGRGKPALSEKAVPESPPAGSGTPVAFPTLAPPKEWSTVTVAVAPAEVAVNNDAARTTNAVIGLTVVSFSRSVQLRRSV
jgi:hypothetical protein